MTRERVAIIGNQAFSLLNFRSELMQDISRSGHEVIALAPDFDSESRAALEKMDVRAVDYRLSRTGLNPVSDLFDTIRLILILRRERPGLVFAYGIKPVIYGMWAAALAGIEKRFALIAGLGYAFADTGSAGHAALNRVARFLYRSALSRCEKVFMQNPDDANDFVRMGIVGRDKIETVSGTGVNLEKWAEAPPVTAPVTFALAARLLPEKGIREFVAAARRVRANAPDTRFLLLGGIDTNPSAVTRAELESWVAEGIVEWTGHVDPRQWLAQTSVYVLPSYYREGVPRSIQEAMALGRPIVTTDAPGCRETVVDGENGFLVQPRDVHGLHAAMARFVDEPALVASMGARSRELAEQRFDVRRINRAMLCTMGLHREPTPVDAAAG